MSNFFAAGAATLALAVGASPANAAVFVFEAGTTVYTQSFDSLAASGTANGLASLPIGVLASETGSSARVNSAYAASTGSDNSGDVYSFGTSSERAFGTLLSGTLTPTIGFGFTNNTGREITGLTISYRGEQWRLGASGRSDRLDFQYAIGTSGLTGSFVDENAFDFVAPISAGTAGALNGNSNAVGIAGTIAGLAIADDQSFALRFVDFNASGADDGLGVDDFRIELSLAPVVTPVPEPATWAMMIGGLGMVGAGVRRRRANLRVHA